jgi:hypothetical protein
VQAILNQRDIVQAASTAAAYPVTERGAERCLQGTGNGMEGVLNCVPVLAYVNVVVFEGRGDTATDAL